MKEKSRTIIIAVEGIDGSGKTAQIERLGTNLAQNGAKVETISFPIYQSFFGREIGSMLRGETLRADQVDARSMCLWYALDRWERLKDYCGGYCDYLLINRYTMSNAVYQSVREIDGQDQWEWVYQLEHKILGLPEPDLYCLLDVDPVCAQKNVDCKGEREYVDGRDVYEQQQGLLQRAKERYLQLAEKLSNVEVVSCMEEGQTLADQEMIAGRIWEMLRERGLVV